MYRNVNGLVVRSVDYKEADRILSVLTDSAGKLTVQVRGARRKGSTLSAAAQLFAYSSMTLFEYHGRYTLNEAEVQRQFVGLSADLDKLALASYLAEVLGTEAEEAPVNPELLRLALNSLYALSEGLAEPSLLKAAFELRYIALCGYAPDLSACALCGKEPAQPLVSLEAGVLHCRACPVPGELGAQAELDSAALQAARYIIHCDLKKLFSFALPPDSLRRLATFCESYLLTKMERGFRTLEFYKSVGEIK